VSSRTFEELQKEVSGPFDVRDADAMLQCAIELDEIGTEKALALAAFTRGKIENERYNYADALHFYKDALSRYQKLDEPISEANTANNIGIINNYTGNYLLALEYLHRARELFETHQRNSGLARALSNIGIAHSNIGNWAPALEFLNRSLSLFEELGDRTQATSVIMDIGGVYVRAGDYPVALEFLQRALDLCEEHNDRRTMAFILSRLGIVHKDTGNYPLALEYHLRELHIFEELDNRPGIASSISNIGLVHAMLGDYTRTMEFLHRALSLNEALGKLGGVAVVLGNLGNVYIEIGDYDNALKVLRRSFAQHQENGDRRSAAIVTSSIITALLRSGSHAEAEEMLDALIAQKVDNPMIRVSILDHQASFFELAGSLDEAERALHAAIAIAKEHSLLASVADHNKRLRDLCQQRNDLAGYIAYNNEYTRITEEINGKETTLRMAMQAKQREIDAKDRETQKQLAVLHSTLPKEVADRVARGEVVNDHYENASVIFLDIVGFTELSSSMPSQDVIALLDDVFTQCDAICAKHNVTKIKTIGDSYMCVSFDSAIDAAHAAVEMSRIQYTIQNTEFNPSMLQYRIGIHCGPVSAGVIGKERMQYDVWGDTVNVASRMESSGEAGRVHVSEAFADNLKSNQESRIKNPISESHEVSHASVARPSVAHQRRTEFPSVAQSELVTRHSSLVTSSVPLVTSHSSLVTQLVTSHLSLVTSSRGFVDIKGKGSMQTYWLEGSAS